MLERGRHALVSLNHGVSGGCVSHCQVHSEFLDSKGCVSHKGRLFLGSASQNRETQPPPVATLSPLSYAHLSRRTKDILQ